MARVLLSVIAAHGNFSGAGYIAGTPPGTVTVSGAAASRTVELRHRDSRAVVAVVRSAPDGSYFFAGVRLDDQYDLIGRDNFNVYNDVIEARHLAVPYAVTLTGALIAVDATNTMSSSIAVAGGVHPLSVSVVSGTAPPGLTFAISSRTLTASGTASNGVYAWTLRVLSASGHFADAACTATFT